MAPNIKRRSLIHAPYAPRTTTSPHAILRTSSSTTKTMKISSGWSVSIHLNLPMLRSIYLVLKSPKRIHLNYQTSFGSSFYWILKHLKLPLLEVPHLDYSFLCLKFLQITYPLHSLAKTSISLFKFSVPTSRASIFSQNVSRIISCLHCYISIAQFLNFYFQFGFWWFDENCASLRNDFCIKKKWFDVKISTILSRFGIDIDVKPNRHQYTLGLFIGRFKRIVPAIVSRNKKSI